LPSEFPATPRELLARATIRLRQAGVQDPRREAVRILADLRGTSPGAVLSGQEQSVEPAEVVAYDRLIARRAAGEPLAYVTGLAGFRQLTLHADRRALIPRPETEGLVALLLERCSGGVVADIGTGSGCIALSLAEEGRFQSVVGVDQSAGALALARENAALTGLRVDLVRGDLTSAFAGECLDAVISNPPYLAQAEYDSLDSSVRDWEPASALVSGDDGLRATRLLLADAFRAVRAGGWIGLEVDSNRAGESVRLALASGWEAAEILDDLYGRERYMLARRSNGL